MTTMPADANMIVLYDIPSKLATKAFSPNPWKARYILNYKGLAYKTVWVEYPDIASVCIKIGATPTGTKPDGSQLYTLPVIQDPRTNTVVSDSLAIAKYLDKTYPDTPTLVPEGTERLQLVFIDAFLQLAGMKLHRFVVPKITPWLNPQSAEYFARTRAVRFKVPSLDTLNPPEGTEEHKRAWAEVEAGLNEVAQKLYARLPGADGEDEVLFAMGHGKLCFTDVQIISMLSAWRNIWGEDSKEWRDIATWNNGKWARLANALGEYSTIH